MNIKNYDLYASKYLIIIQLYDYCHTIIWIYMIIETKYENQGWFLL